MKWYLFFIIIFLKANTSSALGMLDLGGGYISDSFVSTTQNSSNKYFYNVNAFLSINKNWYAGWSYLGFNTTDKVSGTQVALSGYGSGPAVKLIFGKSKVFQLTGTYNILSKGTHTTTSSTETLDGYSYMGQLAVLPEYNDSLRIGVALTYIGCNYSTKTVSNTQSNISYSKSWIIPSFLMQFSF